MVGIFEIHRLEATAVDTQQPGAGKRHDDRRMGGENDLGHGLGVHPVKELQELELAGWRQRRFRLVEQVR